MTTVADSVPKFVIQFVNNNVPTNFCIGVQQPIANSPIVLSLLSGNLTTQWFMDPTSGLIWNAATPAGAPRMYVSLRGNNPSDRTPLVLQSFVPGNIFQQWNWLGTAGRIFNLGAPNSCVDNNGCNLTPGNTIFLFNSGGQCQNWQFLPVAEVDTALAAFAPQPDAGEGPRLRV